MARVLLTSPDCSLNVATFRKSFCRILIAIIPACLTGQGMPLDWHTNANRGFRTGGQAEEVRDGTRSKCGRARERERCS